MGTHEDFTSKVELKGPSDRSFGWVFTAFFLLVGLWPLFRGRPLRGWALALAAVILLVAVLRPSVLHPANRAWMRLGLLMGRIVNPIVTALLFYGVFTPLGLLMRARGKDPLRLRPAPDAVSYWINREPPGPKPETMSRQF